MEIESKALAAVGALVCGKFVLSFLVTLYKFFLRPSKNLKKFGDWAVITGATDGIGKAYANYLAKRYKINICLISRTESKLKDVAAELEEKYGVQTKIIVCDYSDFNEKVREGVAKELKSLGSIGILVNNVGVSYSYPKYFHELDNQSVHNLIEMNIGSTTYMTQMVLEGMLERKKGAIVNITSAAGLYTMPLLAQYSAAKAYVEKFTRGLNAEYSKKGISVQCHAPFYVATKLAKLRKAFTVPTPDAFARIAVPWIGYSDSVVNPFWAHAFQGWVMSVLPSSIVDSGVMSIHAGIRKRGLKKDAAKANKGE